MTWSICARETLEGGGVRFGIAIASRFFAVGSMPPRIVPGRGALCSQALVNPLWPGRAARMLEAGVPMPEVARLLAASDAGAATRQFHGIDAEGRIAAHTGGNCVPWCGSVAGPDVSIAGNMLAGEQVLTATLETFLNGAGRPLERRLIDAMASGEAAGGDARGREAAALLVWGMEEWPELDLRVDNHPAPIDELHRLERESWRRFRAFRGFLATAANPEGVWDRARITAAVRDSEAAFEERGAGG